MADLDAHEAALPGQVEQPGDLEPVEAELLGDLDLRAAVEVVATGDRRRQDDLRGSAVLDCHSDSCSRACGGSFSDPLDEVPFGGESQPTTDEASRAHMSIPRDVAAWRSHDGSPA